jgi:MFS family permease
MLMLRARPQRLLLVANLGVLLAGLPVLLLAFPAPSFAIAVGALVAGIGLETFSVLWDTAMQENVPQEKLSRVYSYDALGSFALIPLAQALIGPIAESFGTRATLFGACALVTATTLGVLGVDDVRNLRRRTSAATA